MNILKNLNKVLNKEVLANPKTSLYRNLSYSEKQAVEVYDFRDISTGNPNNNVIITCEHASNNLHKYSLPQDQRQWLNSHWGYDIAAKDIGLELSEKAKILSMYSNFSRLIIDPNRSLTSNTLIRKTVEGDVELEMNKESVLDEAKRIENFYLPYYRVMKEVLSFLKPRYAISSHSFTKQYEKTAERNFEVGILYRDRGLLADMIESAYKREGVSYRVNEPYSPKDGVCQAVDALNTWNWPEWYTDVVLLEFRNDYCSDPSWRKKQVNILSQIVDTLKDKH